MVIWALVISSTGHSWVSGVILQREGMGQSQCLPGPMVVRHMRDLIMPPAAVSSLQSSSHMATITLEDGYS